MSLQFDASRIDFETKETVQLHKVTVSQTVSKTEAQDYHVCMCVIVAHQMGGVSMFN